MSLSCWPVSAEPQGWLAAWTGAKPLSDVQRLFIRFRMLRKRALKYWIQRLQDVLDTADAQEEL